MEDVSAIFKEIAAGGSHIGELYEELRCLRLTPEQIRQGVEEARAQEIQSNAQIGLRPIALTQCT